MEKQEAGWMTMVTTTHGGNDNREGKDHNTQKSNKTEQAKNITNAKQQQETNKLITIPPWQKWPAMNIPSESKNNPNKK